MSTNKNNFWNRINKPIKVLAPMAGYTDSAFRLLCRKYGADVVITELISADAIAYTKLNCNSSYYRRKSYSDSRKVKTNGKEDFLFCNKVISDKNQSTAELLSFFEAERPIVVQLFGKYPEKFAAAAKMDHGNLKPDGIDINMGCPARKVVGSDHGAALLKKPELAVEIVKAVKKNTYLPVSVKTRLGWENDDEILNFVPKLVDAGIDAIIIHGRTYKDGFKGKARWENIYKIKEMFGDKLIVIGNGDIANSSQFSAAPTGRQVLNSQLGNLDGFAVGAVAFGKPWIFNEAEDKSQITNHKSQKSSKSEKSNFETNKNCFAFLKNIILQHADLVYKTKGEHGMIEFRKHLLAYLKGLPDAKLFRMEAVKVKSLDDIEKIINKI